MLDSVMISGAYASLKAAKELLKGAFDAKVDGEVKSKVYDAMERLGSALDTLYDMRSDLFDLQEANNKLRQQLSDANAWAERSASYGLATAPGGAVVYKFNGTPDHWACPSCFNKQQIQPLQTNRAWHGRYRCVGCQAEFPIELKRVAPAAPPPQRIPYPNRW